jgi:hypothetical protein
MDITDVEKAIRFITTTVRSQHFKSKFDSIMDGVQTSIVRAMAAAPYETVNIPYLLMKLNRYNDSEIIGPLDYLTNKVEVIENVGRGQYCFRDPLFKVYLKMLFRMNR